MNRFKKLKRTLSLRIIIQTLIIAGIGILVLNSLIEFIPGRFLHGRPGNDFFKFLYMNRNLFTNIMYLIIIIFAIYYSVSKAITYMENEVNAETLEKERVIKESEQKKNDLIVYMAHDLKTPLTSMIGYLNLVKDNPDLENDLKQKYLDIVSNKSERLEDLINEFFDITRLHSEDIVLEKEDISLTILLNQLVEEFYPELNKKKLNCKLNIEKNININADSNKLARVFSNLLKNAINYSIENTDININVLEENETVIIKFRNIAKKIPDYKLNQIFEKFYRLDSSRSSDTGGAGLGLAIAKEIIELHGGNISVVSNDDYTEFTVKIHI